MPKRAARVLPVQTPAPLPLDNLMARVGLVAQPHRSRSPAPSATRPERPPPDRPTALVLCITVSHCACGTTTRAPAAYALARYDLNGHSFRYSRHDTADCASLPRERREIHINVPFCEECF